MRDEIEKKIHKLTQSTNDIDLKGMNINDDDIVEIIEQILQASPNIRRINLNNNELTDNGATLLAQYLSDSKTLTTLCLQNNKIDKVGYESIFKLKNNLPRLDILLRDNKINNVTQVHELQENALKR